MPPHLTAPGRGPQTSQPGCSELPVWRFGILRAMPKGMTQSWIAAMATLPPEWRLMGVALGPREVDPQIRSESWVAWARGPNGERVDGQAGSAQGALDAGLGPSPRKR